MLTTSASVIHFAYRKVGSLTRTAVGYASLRRKSSIASSSLNSAEGVIRCVEELALENCTCSFTAQATSDMFRNASYDMTPLQLLRGINAYAQIGFCNKTILVSISDAMHKFSMTSPRYIAQLVTLLRRHNITHPSVVDPVLSAVKAQLHNYVVELPELIANSVYLGMTDQDQIEMYRTQALLHITELGSRSIRCAEAMSRLRSDKCSFIDRVLEEYVPRLTELKWKQLLYLVAAAGRYKNSEASSLTINHLVSHLDVISLTAEDISMLLSVQRSLGVVVPKLVDVVINSMELLLKDPEYTKGMLAYHIYMLCLLGYSDSLTLLEMIQRIVHSDYATASQSLHLIYAISLMNKAHGKKIVTEDRFNSLLNHLDSCYRHLTLKQQRELHEALASFNTDEGLPVGLSTFFSSKIVTSLPTMCKSDSEHHLGSIGGLSYLYLHNGNGGDTALVCVNDSGTLTTLDKGTSVSLSPSMRQYVYTLEHLLCKHKNAHQTTKVEYNVHNHLRDQLVL
ncbi:uncharacterized protein BBOV_IV008385 [Babesia bovis T2Bo]|uniref:uncharacterized protein n=1 Tax=Babesia bovis T2Bo TaxID=484906 RepID=UPI001DBD172C|nr:uncharacterized protein BBOV_IV008385 [Babesia bovis T2Bo]KAG6439935.1 hypothetical protein BBOV_IV008385 [Babesia bovis T2Bo]